MCNSSTIEKLPPNVVHAKDVKTPPFFTITKQNRSALPPGDSVVSLTFTLISAIWPGMSVSVGVVDSVVFSVIIVIAIDF